MKKTILTLIMLLAGTAPVSAAFLGANPRLGESFLNTGIKQVARDVSREMPPGSGGAWLRGASEFFVAPGRLSPGQLGRQGESLASEISGAGKNTQSFVVNGRTRIPDQVLAQDIATRRPTIIGEVKNVQRQSLTRQLRDDIDLVGPGGRVDVYLPPGARVTRPLQRAFDDPLNPLNRVPLVRPQ